MPLTTNHLEKSKIKSLTQYMDLISKFNKVLDITPTRTLWFRGQSDKDFDLLPSIYRNKNHSYFEREMNRDFKLLSNALVDKNPSNELEWLFLMQHYGLQTRLLDWTESPLVALFFAVVDYCTLNDSSVWILRPSYLNLVSLGEKTITTCSNPELLKYTLGEPHLGERKVSGVLPVAIRPERNSARIVAQKGTFTIHGNLLKPLNLIIKENNSKNHIQIPLHCLTIDAKSKLNILKELSIAGISFSVIFPDIEGLCREIKLKYSDDFTYNVDLAQLL